MPSECETSDDADESTPTGPDTDQSGGRRPRDPVLVLVRAFDRVLRRIDALHARLETFPGRVQFGIALLTFVSSTYFGTAIKRAVDSFVGRAMATLVTEFMAFSPGMKVVLVVTVLLVVQVAVANEKLTNVGNIVEDAMNDDERVTDGGVQTRRVETTGAWAQGGATLGAGFGAVFGISTIFGGLIFGAIVGNLAEEWKAKRRKRRRFPAKVVEYLLRERVFTPETVESATVRGWFPTHEEGFVVDAIEELIREDDSPVVQQSGGLTLVGDAEAVAYLDRNGGHIPSAFAGPNRPPRPSEEQ